MPRTSQPRLRRYGIASQTGLLAAIASLEQINLTNQLARKFAAQLSMACPPEDFRALGLERRQAQFTRSEEHTSELQSLMRKSYAVFCLKKKQQHNHQTQST